MRASRILRAVSVALLLVACGDGEETTSSTTGDPVEQALFPADYAATYTEVRNCRQSGDHDLNIIRVLADPAMLNPYQTHDQALPVGGVLLKEEFDFSDPTCEGPIKQWTVMVRLEKDAAPDALDWKWQEVQLDGTVTTEQQKCVGCHTGCTPEAGGYEYSCTVP